MPKLLRPVICRLGFRGAMLLNIGSIWFLIGVVRKLAPQDKGTDAVLLYELFPAWWAVWMVAGSVAFVASFYDRPRRDVWGFGALSFPPMVVAISYAWSALVWLFTGGEYGYYLGPIYAVGWTLIALLPYTAAGGTDPAPNGGR